MIDMLMFIVCENLEDFNLWYQTWDNKFLEDISSIAKRGSDVQFMSPEESFAHKRIPKDSTIIRNFSKSSPLPNVS